MVLGPEEEAGHRAVGEAAATCSDTLVAVGPLAQLIADAAAAKGMRPENIVVVSDAETAAGIVVSRSDLGSVLVKGPGPYRLDLVVTALVPDAEVVQH